MCKQCGKEVVEKWTRDQMIYKNGKVEGWIRDGLLFCSRECLNEDIKENIELELKRLADL